MSYCNNKKSTRNINRLKENLKKLESELNKMKEVLKNSNTGKMEMQPVYLHLPK